MSWYRSRFFIPQDLASNPDFFMAILAQNVLIQPSFPVYLIPLESALPKPPSFTAAATPHPSQMASSAVKSPPRPYAAGEGPGRTVSRLGLWGLERRGGL